MVDAYLLLQLDLEQSYRRPQPRINEINNAARNNDNGSGNSSGGESSSSSGKAGSSGNTGNSTAANNVAGQQGNNPVDVMNYKSLSFGRSVMNSKKKIYLLHVPSRYFISLSFSSFSSFSLVPSLD